MILPADKTSADSEAGAWDNRRQREATEDKKLTKAQAGAEETRTNSYAGADADHAVDTADASETAALKINQAEATRATALAGEEPPKRVLTPLLPSIIPSAGYLGNECLLASL